MKPCRAKWSEGVKSIFSVQVRLWYVTHTANAVLTHRSDLVIVSLAPRPVRRIWRILSDWSEAGGGAAPPTLRVGRFLQSACPEMSKRRFVFLPLFSRLTTNVF